MKQTNYKNQIKNMWSLYNKIDDKSYDDQFFANKYGEIDIESRKEFYIWKTNIDSMVKSKEEKAELEKKYNIKF